MSRSARIPRPPPAPAPAGPPRAAALRPPVACSIRPYRPRESGDRTAVCRSPRHLPSAKRIRHWPAEGCTTSSLNAVSIRFFERLTHRLGSDALGVSQLHELAGEQAYGPAAAARRWLAARQRNQASLLIAVQLAMPMPRLGTAAQHGVQSLLDPSLPDPIDGDQPHPEVLLNGEVRPAGSGGPHIRFEQDPSPLDGAGRGLPSAHQSLQTRAFLILQPHDVLFVHRRDPPPGCKSP